MLQIKILGPNQILLLSEKVKILFSYETPVAYEDVATGKVFATEKNFSRTTTRHVNTWLDGKEPELVAQDQIEAILSGVQIDPAPQAAESDVPGDEGMSGGEETLPVNPDSAPAPIARALSALRKFAQFHDDPDLGFDDEDEMSDCPMCGHMNSPMGDLGNRTHYRCRYCGMEYSHERPMGGRGLSAQDDSGVPLPDALRFKSIDDAIETYLPLEVGKQLYSECVGLGVDPYSYTEDGQRYMDNRENWGPPEPDFEVTPKMHRVWNQLSDGLKQQIADFAEADDERLGIGKFWRDR